MTGQTAFWSGCFWPGFVSFFFGSASCLRVFAFISGCVCLVVASVTDFASPSDFCYIFKFKGLWWKGTAMCGMPETLAKMVDFILIIIATIKVKIFSK